MDVFSFLFVSAAEKQNSGIVAAALGREWCERVRERGRETGKERKRKKSFYDESVSPREESRDQRKQRRKCISSRSTGDPSGTCDTQQRASGRTPSAGFVGKVASVCVCATRKPLLEIHRVLSGPILFFLALAGLLKRRSSSTVPRKSEGER